MAADPYQLLGICPNPDGTMKRSNIFPITSSSSDLSDLSVSVLSKDIPLNQTHNTWVRLFLPKKALENSSSPTHPTYAKLPIIIFFHGGGFVIFSAATSPIHDFCSNMASAVHAVVASVDYRLAPEHRLPAAYDDATEALHWIKTTDDVWLREYADYSNCYLAGASAGANIAFHIGQRVAADVVDHLEPLKIKGLILHQPFFGGVQRSESEQRLIHSNLIPLCVTDLMWELSLPIGFDRDHEYSNPMMHSECHKLVKEIKSRRWRVMVVGCEGDPLVDRQKDFAKVLEEKGVEVVAIFELGHGHAFELFEQSESQLLLQEFKNFVCLSKDAVLHY